jgi:hypothetical protein
MTKTIVINSNNYVKGSGNKFVYTFPSAGAKFQAGDKVGLQQINIFNSTFNISQTLNNNTFSIIWPANFADGSTSKTFNFTIPDGYYSVAQLNYFLQDCCLKNKLYLVSSTSNTSNTYFITFTSNSIFYALEIDTYVLPTSSTLTSSGYIYPANSGWTVASTIQSPQITLCSGLLTWFGFINQVTFPATSTYTINQQFISNSCPVVNPVNSYILTTNLVSSPYSSPSNFFHSIPLTSGFGTMISNASTYIVYHDIQPATYTSLVLELFDQNFNPLQFIDKDVLIILALENGN